MKHALAGLIAVLVAAVPQSVDLAPAKLRPVGRQVSPIQERSGVHVSAADGPGVAWVEGSDFGEGTIDVDVRGRDVMQQSFVGVAFHRKDDQTYESVYLRPFNFQATDPARHTHAVQYMQVPEFDWPVLRQKFPEEFERAVDASIKPTDWVHLRVVVKGGRVQAFVGSATTPTLDVRKLGQLGSGMAGLWVGNNSDGDFANMKIAKFPPSERANSTRRTTGFEHADYLPPRTEWICAASARFAGVGDDRTSSSMTRSLSRSRPIAR